jgi:hypothetical protein
MTHSRDLITHLENFVRRSEYFSDRCPVRSGTFRFKNVGYRVSWVSATKAGCMGQEAMQAVPFQGHGTFLTEVKYLYNASWFFSEPAYCPLFLLDRITFHLRYLSV